MAWTWVVGSSLIVLGSAARADAGYQETTQITGGSLVDSLRAMPFLPKSTKRLFEPTVSSVALHGNQLARISTSSTEIIDLDQETITRIDHDKKTYTVTPFAQMREAMKNVPKTLEAAEEKAKASEPAAGAPPPSEPRVSISFDVSVTDTGASKPINGVPSKEQIMTMKAHVTPVDPQPADQVQSVTYSVITDLWTAPEPPEMQAIDDFYARYAKKLMQGVDTAQLMKSMQSIANGSAIAPLFASQPGMSAAVPDMMKRMAAEMEKIKGVRILEITRMGGEAMMPPAPGTVPAAPAAGAPNGPSVASTAVNQAAADTTTSALQQQVSKLGAIGSAFGGSMLGAFHKSPPPTPAAAPAGAGAAPAATSAVLYEMTTQKSGFSQEPLAAALFQIPAGYRKVDLPAPSLSE